MLSDEVLEKVIDRLTERINQGNEYIISEIGKSIGQLRTVTPSKAHQLGQLLKYGGNYEKIVAELTKITKLNEKEIYQIFDEVAKNNYEFAEQFYNYRDIDYIPYDEHSTLKNTVDAIAKITADEYVNISNTRTIGYAIKDDDGNLIFRNIKQTYYEMIDEAILNVDAGKETFDSALYRNLKEIGESGLKVVYPSTYVDKEGRVQYYTRRLDSAIKMNMRDGLRQLHNETQEIFGEEFDADGVEISVHGNPADDHADVQGRQFSKEEYEKLQTEGYAKDYEGHLVDMRRYSKKGNMSFRPISQYNCYHYIFNIVLGVDTPEYTEEQLEKINEENEKGFDFEGKHYTNYEGTQLQRRIETEIRKAKDNQIIGKASKNVKLIDESQQRITQLTNKYRKLNKISGLPDAISRARVIGYKRVAKSKLK